jgi:hypothetical protein
VASGATVALFAGELALSSTPALAAAPEVPELTVEQPVHATTATFHGTVNPNEALEPNNKGGTYKFVYKVGLTCTGGSQTKPAGLWSGGVHEELPAATVTGLIAHTKYTVCLSVTNLEDETTRSAPVSFETATPPEAPLTGSGTSITATSVTLEGTLNPHSAEKVGGYFAYSNANGSSCTEGPIAGLVGFEAEPEKEEEAIAVKAPVEGLEPNREYKVCLIATNDLGESTQGNEVTVKTLSPPPEVVNESESAPTPATHSEATFSAAVNPENQETECHFQYGMGSVSEHEVPCEPAEMINGLEQGVNATVTGLQLEATYKYRVVLKNIADEERQGLEQPFETLDTPSQIVTAAAEGITGTSANLGGGLNAGGEAKYYVEYGTAPCSVSTCGEKSYELDAGGKTQGTVTPIVVNGLEPLTTYHYWLVAINGATSEPVHGEAKEFTTTLAAPSVETGAPDPEDLTPTSAVIPGQIDPGGEAEYFVEYGTTACSATSCGAATAPTFVRGKTQTSVTPIALSGLQPNTTYYYWLVARNGAATQPVQGEARRFTTPASLAEEEAQAAAKRKPAEEAEATATAKHKLEEEALHTEEASEAANALKQQQYNEVAAETAALERHEAEVKRLEEPIAAEIAATSVRITKTKVTADHVSVTLEVSEPGTVTITGAGLKKAVVKVAAGTRTVEIALTRNGKTARKHHRKIAVTASLTTSLTTVSAAATVKL